MKNSMRMSLTTVLLGTVALLLTSACVSAQAKGSADEIYQPDTRDKSSHLLKRQESINATDDGKYGLKWVKFA